MADASRTGYFPSYPFIWNPRKHRRRIHTKLLAMVSSNKLSNLKQKLLQQHFVYRIALVAKSLKKLDILQSFKSSVCQINYVPSYQVLNIFAR